MYIEAARQDGYGNAMHQAKLDQMALVASAYAARWSSLAHPGFPCSQTCKNATRIAVLCDMHAT